MLLFVRNKYLPYISPSDRIWHIENYKIPFNFSFDIINRTIKTDESIDRTQGSTHLPEYPCVDMHKPMEYQRTLTLNDVSNIRLVKEKYQNNMFETLLLN